MKTGTLYSAVVAASVLTWAGGCGWDTGSGTDPFLVGDHGKLRFSAAGACGFDERCSTESGGFHLDAEEVGLSTSVAVSAYTETTTAMPQLEFESANPDVFAVRTTWCERLLAGVEEPFEPCPVDSPGLYSVELDLRSEGRADLVARLASDGTVYDRGTVRIRPPLCDNPDSAHPRCVE